MYKIPVLLVLGILSFNLSIAQSMYNHRSTASQLEHAFETSRTAQADLGIYSDAEIVNNKYQIYPNLVSSFLELTTGHSELTKIKISNSYGQEMHQSVIRDRALINCATWKKGNYQMELRRNNLVEIKNFTISY